MRVIITTALLVLLIILLLLVLTFAASVGIALVGWVLNLIFPALSVFQGSLIAFGVGLGVTFGFARLMSTFPSPPSEDEEDEDEDEEDDQEFEPPIVRWRRERPTPSLPSQSRKKRP